MQAAAERTEPGEHDPVGSAQAEAATRAASVEAASS